VSDEEYAFPQPFRYSQHSSLYLPAEKGTDGMADLYVYTVSMDLVYSATTSVSVINKTYVIWDVLDNAGKKLPSGVYIYVCKTGDSIKKGKIVVYND
jgi:hypothetical protein